MTPRPVTMESEMSDLVQAAVAAALREAAALMFDDLWITADNDREEGYDEGLSAAANAILALITPDAQAALDRQAGGRAGADCAKVAGKRLEVVKRSAWSSRV
jgi:hypothetical protein